MLLPLFASAGQFLGPLIGGFLSMKPGVGALGGHPYAPPNVFVAAYYLFVSILVVLFLHETLDTHKKEQSVFHALFQKVRLIFTRLDDHGYTALQADESAPPALADHEAPQPPTTSNPPSTTKPSFLSIWTRNVFCTMLAHFIISGHLATFSILWSIFLATPTSPSPPTSPPFKFTGGLAMSPRTIGLVMSSLSALGVVLQLAVYPRLNDRFSTVRIWQTALLVFPVVYFLAPFTSLIASTSTSTPGGGTGSPAVWATLILVLTLFVAGRTGVTPATTLLINDCITSPNARATINTIGTTCGNLSRSVFPVVALAVYGLGLRVQVIGLGFWCVSGLAVLAIGASRWVRSPEEAAAAAAAAAAVRK